MGKQLHEKGVIAYKYLYNNVYKYYYKAKLRPCQDAVTIFLYLFNKYYDLTEYLFGVKAYAIGVNQLSVMRYPDNLNSADSGD